MEREELAAWLRLQATDGVGSQTARKLMAAFGLPVDIFKQSAAALSSVVTPAQVTALQAMPPELTAHVNLTLKWLQAEPGVRRVLVLGDPQYPQMLLHMEDPPLLLYAMGPADLWDLGGINAVADSSLAVVGSRNPTPQGDANARQFALALARAGHTIVSGMALGVDAAAHEGALEGAPLTRAATIAVVGTGLDRVYPRQHRVLAHRIYCRGFLLSEYALGTPPLATNFPRRNRLIAGLSRGTLVVEAALQSGSLITARLAAEQGKEVFAIPGSIHSTQARGCHALIRQGAKLVESARDILEELPPAGAAVVEIAGTTARAAPDPVLDALGFDPVALDELLARTGLAAAALQARLMTLELAGEVARIAGGRFQRLARA